MSGSGQELFIIPKGVGDLREARVLFCSRDILCPFCNFIEGSGDWNQKPGSIFLHGVDLYSTANNHK